MLQILIFSKCFWLVVINVFFQDVSSFYKFANKLLELDPVKDIEPDTDLFTLILQFLQEHLLKSLSFDQVELRISAFNLVTNIPLKFVPGLFSLLPVVWNQIFKLSSSIPELANSALKSIHGYLETFPESELELILEKVLPNLRVYLSYQHQTSENAEIKMRRRRAPVVKRTRSNLKESVGIAKNYEEENCQLALGILAKVRRSYTLLHCTLHRFPPFPWIFISQEFR